MLDYRHDALLVVHDVPAAELPIRNNELPEQHNCSIERVLAPV